MNSFCQNNLVTITYIVMFVQNKRLGSHQTLIYMQYTMYMNWKANNLLIETDCMKEDWYIIHWSYLDYVWSLKCFSLFGKKNRSWKSRKLLHVCFNVYLSTLLWSLQLKWLINNRWLLKCFKVNLCPSKFWKINMLPK